MFCQSVTGWHQMAERESGEKSNVKLTRRWKNERPVGGMPVPGPDPLYDFETAKGSATSKWKLCGACHLVAECGTDEKEGPALHCTGKSTSSALITRKWAPWEVWGSVNGTDGDFNVGLSSMTCVSKSSNSYGAWTWKSGAGYPGTPKMPSGAVALWSGDSGEREECYHFLQM